MLELDASGGKRHQAKYALNLRLAQVRVDGKLPCLERPCTCRARDKKEVEYLNIATPV